jgi:fructokinase
MRIGIDVGGTKIEALALDDQGHERARRRVPTPGGDYGGTLVAIVELVATLERELGERGSIGVGHPGVTSPATGRIKNSNSACINGKAFEQDLARALGRPVRLANDANCFAVSEATDGAAAGLSSVFGVILGTGVGGGLVIEGRPLVGANAIAGEWGHVPLPRMTEDERVEQPWTACDCGRFGCIEAFLSGPALARDHAHATGRVATAIEIVAAAETGDADSRATIERYAERLARALAMVIDIVDPHGIVLGGGVSHCRSLYTRVPELWAAHVFSDRIDTKLLPPRFGDSSGVRGAAWLW